MKKIMLVLWVVCLGMQVEAVTPVSVEGSFGGRCGTLFTRAARLWRRTPSDAVSATPVALTSRSADSAVSAPSTNNDIQPTTTAAASNAEDKLRIAGQSVVLLVGEETDPDEAVERVVRAVLGPKSRMDLELATQLLAGSLAGNKSDNLAEAIYGVQEALQGPNDQDCLATINILRERVCREVDVYSMPLQRGVNDLRSLIDLGTFVPSRRMMVAMPANQLRRLNGATSNPVSAVNEVVSQLMGAADAMTVSAAIEIMRRLVDGTQQPDLLSALTQLKAALGVTGSQSILALVNQLSENLMPGASLQVLRRGTNDLASLVRHQVAVRKRSKSV